MYSNESLLFRYVYAALVLSLSLQYVFVTCPMLQCFFHRIVLVASNIKTQGISEAFRKQDTWQNALEGASISEKIEYPHLLIMINDHHPWGCHSHHILSPPPSSCSQKVENGAESVSVSEKHFIICCPLTIAAAISSYLPSSWSSLSTWWNKNQPCRLPLDDDDGVDDDDDGNQIELEAVVASGLGREQAI